MNIHDYAPPRTVLQQEAALRIVAAGHYGAAARLVKVQCQVLNR